MRLKIVLYTFLVFVLLLSSCSGGNTAAKPANGTAPARESTAAGAADSEAGHGKQTAPGIDFFIEPEYDFCSTMIDGIIEIQKGQDQAALYGFVDERGNTVAGPVYQETGFYVGASDASSGFSEGLARVKKEGKWGYIDREGKVVIDFKYASVSSFSAGLSAVSTGGGIYGYINTGGETVIKPMYGGASGFHNGVAFVQADSGWGFINKQGEWLVRPGYDYIDSGRWDYDWTKNNIVKIYKNDLQGFVKIGDGTAKVIAEPVYSKLYPFRGGEARFVIQQKDKNGVFMENAVKGGYADENGEVLCRWSGSGGMDFSYLAGGLRAAQNEKGKWGFADEKFRMVIPCKYDNAEDFYEGAAVVKSGGRSGLIDKKGKVLLPPAYDSLLPFISYGFIIAEQDGQKFLIGTKDYKVVSGRYDDIGRGQKALPVKKGGKIGFIDSSGKEISKAWYDEGKEFEFWEDYEWVKAGGSWICVGNDGSEAFSGEFDDVSAFDDGYAGVMKDGKWGVVDARGNMAAPAVFERVEVNSNGLVKVTYNGKYGYIKLR